MTIQDTYNNIYKIHYKFLAQNHMSDDRSKRLATIYAIQNTWKVYNQPEPTRIIKQKDKTCKTCIYLLNFQCQKLDDWDCYNDEPSFWIPPLNFCCNLYKPK